MTLEEEEADVEGDVVDVVGPAPEAGRVVAAEDADVVDEEEGPGAEVDVEVPPI